MTKNELVSRIEFILNNYKAALAASGIDVSKYQQEFEKRTVPQVKEGLQWLEARAEDTERYYRIRALLKDEIWERYKHMDTEDFREVVLLNEAIARIKKSFVGRPALFRKVKDASKCKRRSTVEA